MTRNFTRRSAWLVLTLFVFTMLGSALFSATKQEIFEVSNQIKALKHEIKLAYAELRKLNEEGGPEAQEQAQLIMEHIKIMKEDLDTLNAVLANMKKNVR
ncbi:MAG: hypothetical protein Kow0029_27900 [Candidatus Rifleibacteriota bacterium]